MSDVVCEAWMGASAMMGVCVCLGFGLCVAMYFALGELERFYRDICEEWHD